MLDKLHLNHCADRMVSVGGGLMPVISGGERKRICIAFEMITNPKVIILDEPTSGLDSTSAYRVMKLMQKEARSGKIVIATIHMPSSETFLLFDKVMLLSEGHCIYHGGVKEIPSYFDKNFSAHFKAFTNPCDFIINIAHNPARYNKTLTLDKLVSVAKKHETLAIEYSDGDPSLLKASRKTLMYYNQNRSSNFFVQFFYLLHRYLISSIRAPLFKFVFIISIYSSYLYSVKFDGFGRIDMEKSLRENNKIFEAWLCIVFLMSRNCMYQINGAESL